MRVESRKRDDGSGINSICQGKWVILKFGGEDRGPLHREASNARRSAGVHYLVDLDVDDDWRYANDA